MLAGSRVLLAECGVCVIRSSCSTAIVCWAHLVQGCEDIEQAEELRQLGLMGPDEVVMDAAGSGSKGLEM